MDSKRMLWLQILDDLASEMRDQFVLARKDDASLTPELFYTQQITLPQWQYELDLDVNLSQEFLCSIGLSSILEAQTKDLAKQHFKTEIKKMFLGMVQHSVTCS